MNNPNLKKKFQCYYEKLLLSKTVQLVTFIVKDILGDPGADSGGEGKSKQAGKYGTREK